MAPRPLSSRPCPLFLFPVWAFLSSDCVLFCGSLGSSGSIFWPCVPSSVIGPIWGHVKMFIKHLTQCLVFIKDALENECLFTHLFSWGELVSLTTSAEIHDFQFGARNLHQNCICITLKNNFVLSENGHSMDLKPHPHLSYYLAPSPPIKTSWQANYSTSVFWAYTGSCRGCRDIIQDETPPMPSKSLQSTQTPR